MRLNHSLLTTRDRSKRPLFLGGGRTKRAFFVAGRTRQAGISWAERAPARSPAMRQRKARIRPTAFRCRVALFRCRIGRPPFVGARAFAQATTKSTRPTGITEACSYQGKRAQRRARAHTHTQTGIKHAKGERADPGKARARAHAGERDTRTHARTRTRARARTNERTHESALKQTSSHTNPPSQAHLPANAGARVALDCGARLYACVGVGARAHTHTHLFRMASSPPQLLM